VTVPTQFHKHLSGSEKPEVQLLLACARSVVDESNAAQITALAAKTMDWERLVYLGIGHGVVPLLYRSLNSVRPAGVPSNVLQRFRSRAQEIAGRNLLLATELLSLLDLLNANGISVMPYKGPALACQVYGELRLRSFIDLDILVRRSDIPKVRTLLAENGYQPKLKMTAGKERAILRSECDEVFTGPSGRILEVHWAITPPFFAFQLDTEDLFARATKIEILGKSVLAPSPEDLLLILTVNGAKDMWNRLEFICRVAELINRYPDIHWPTIFSRARELGADRMLLLGLFLAHQLLGASLPADVLQRLQQSKILWGMANQVCERLFFRPEDTPSQFELTRFRLRSRERLRDRFTYCFKRALSPTYKDLENLSLPRSLEFLYPLVRPFRLIRW
jgi:putative nucleotidyltransferase-like protein